MRDLVDHITGTMTDPAIIRTFVLAGNATITLQSQKSNRHFTYRIHRAPDSEVWFVSVAVQHDLFHYLGVISPMARSLQFKWTAKSKVQADALSFLGFFYFWRHIETNRMPPDMIVRHENRCGRCGRPLTHPSSIDAGIGPECASIMGL